MPSENLQNFYSVYKFPEDIETEVGSKRFELLKKDFKRILEHEWLKEILNNKDTVSFVDICSGKGMGAFALANALKETGKKFEAYMVDARCDALKHAEKTAAEKFGFKPKTICSNILEADNLPTNQDIVIMVGKSAPHFSPWDMIKLLFTASEMLSENGILILDEGDRIYSILVKSGYRDFLIEYVDEKNAVATIHKGYNWKTGMFTRAAYNLFNPTKIVFADVYFWSLSELMALAWLFFQDIDFIKESESRYASGFILAKQPRKRIKKEDIDKTPKILKDNK
ncbi:MAG: hypothetical protein ACP6IP_10890 [Candidatus Njordarchaeia archaeon]